MGSKLGSTLFALVFLIAFGGVGFGATWGFASVVRDSVRADDWVLVQAKVESAELNASRGSKGGMTYQASGTYRYTVGGKEHVSTRLGFDLLGGSDNIGDWQQSMAGFLQEAKASGKSIPVFVNPDNPAEAVVDRDVRWGMVILLGVFALTFGGVGVGALIGIGFIWFGKDRGKVSKGAAKHGKPAGVASASSGLLGIWIFAFFWNVVSFPAAFLILPPALAKGEWAALLILIFPLVGLCILWSAISGTAGLLRRGKPTLALEPAQPKQGARFSGVARYAKGVEAGEEFVVRLCASDTTDGRSVTRWWKDLPVRAVADPAGGARVPFQFDPPARVPGMRTSGEWVVSVQPKGSGMGAGDFFPIEIQPAPDLTEDAPPQFPGSEERRYEADLARMLGPAAVAKLTPEQRASFKDLSPEDQMLAVNWARNAGTVKWVAIGIGVLFVIGMVLAT